MANLPTYPDFITDSKKRPYPQYYNPKAIAWEVVEGEQGSYSVKQIGSLVIASFEKTGNFTYTSPDPLRGLAIINDGDADIVVTVNGMTIKIKGGEMFDECFRVFTVVTVTTTSTYRMICRA